MFFLVGFWRERFGEEVAGGGVRVIPESRGAEGKAEGQPFADLNYRWRQLRFFFRL